MSSPESSRSRSSLGSGPPPPSPPLPGNSSYNQQHRRTHSRSDPLVLNAPWDPRPQYQRPPIFEPTFPHVAPPPPLPHSRSADSRYYLGTDRKRRLTGQMETGRRRPTSAAFASPSSHDIHDLVHRLPSSSNGPQPPIFPTRNRQPEVVDLTQSSPPSGGERELPPRPSMASPPRPRSYRLPSWQPDSEVTECPICHRQFGFMFRRHHCRKCGRVVCNDCSPHRITIPRQYIVHPPGMNNDFIDLTRDEPVFTMAGVQRRPYANPALGGGEKVRLCNPCVPDPQPEQPPSNSPLFDASMRSPTIASGFATHISDLDRRRAQNPRTQPFPPHPGTRIRIDDDDEDNLNSSSPEAEFPTARYHGMNVVPSNPFEPPPPGHARYHSIDVSRMPTMPQHPFIANRPRIRSMLDSRHPRLMSPTPPTPLPPSRPQAPRPPRPRIREEDMCPVCRGQLPPIGPNGDETARESHIIDCISQHDTTLTHASRQRTEQHILSTSLATNDGDTDVSTSLASSSLSPPPPRVPAQMLRFVATEKDCMAQPDEHGEPQQQECSICMVEYEVGDRMARLECWCKFHEECIVEWFGRKRECPVHKVA